ncbi:sulfate permease 2 [Xylariomycetidae sp. FL2044]|nr:sulfate permease 2 [Xylariomycetidae sp. FL2044]
MAANTALGRAAAKAVGIDLNYRKRSEPTDYISSTASQSLSPASIEPYYESEPSVKQYLQDHVPTLGGAQRYLRSLFPFLDWIFHYNLTWLGGDFIAGVTVGFVVIPQGMAYALLAGLPAEYGLYTSFVGFILYFAFATSKDITIGTVAVMSTLVGRIVNRVTTEHPELPPEMIARGLSVIAGAVLLFIGLARLGWIVEFIPLVAICSFMTGAAINILVGQVPKLMGIKGVNTREATYKVIIDTLKGLPKTKIDAAMGLTALFMLYALRWFCEFMAKRQPAKKKMWFFVGTLRLAFVILLYTLISWLANRNVTDAKKAKFEILRTVPSGFRVHGAPTINAGLISAIASDLPATIIVLIIEHIAISKSFGRINNYSIVPSQELVAVGFTNIFGPFLGAYPATGSFSRTAIKAKAGVRTPLAGLWTAVMVVLALYALTKVFFYIPMSSLSGLIIHAVGDLVTPPDTVYRFWQVSPIEVFLFFAGVIIMIFTDIETGIYFSVCASVALLLVRMRDAKGSFLGKADVYHISKDTTIPIGGDSSPKTTPTTATDAAAKQIYLPLDRADGSNPDVAIVSPYPGVFIYRFTEGLNYTNAARYMDDLVLHIQKQTRRTTLHQSTKIGDRPWNDPGPRPRRGQRGKGSDAEEEEEDRRPVLRAVVLDCAAVNYVDVTSVQGLIDTRTQLDLHAAPDSVEWHFAGVQNPWTRRSLAAAGFGYPGPRDAEALGERWRPLYSVATAAAAARKDDGVGHAEKTSTVRVKDVEAGVTDDDGIDRISSSTGTDGAGETKGGVLPGKAVAVRGVNRPFFHLDVATAVANVVANAERRILADKIA